MAVLALTIINERIAETTNKPTNIIEPGNNAFPTYPNSTYITLAGETSGIIIYLFIILY